ncbi:MULTISPECIES: hypothetical protein [unclassified Streptomyces]|uniref:hypothetical protein n=1 Tax=unclassified Streptomyces TaxID=2593676 RepID=UPI001F03F32A|nr:MULTISPECIES: hypothetical protein [unclassified Streptomyces]MCH0562094.1 hypothetical protein [Streptomyces sp. MUM 2J]MCH0568099.1 hypothetical protein [Streptomyces sp. MUM 136J]
MRLPSRALKAFTLAALPLALAACGPSGSSGATGAAASGSPSSAPAVENPNAGLLRGTELKKVLAPASYFPSGFAAQADLTRDTGAHYRAPATKSAAKPDCTHLGYTGWVDLTGIEGVSFAQSGFINDATSAELDQEIDVYRGDTAADVMKGLAAVVAACPTYHETDPASTVKVTGAAKGGIGDETYTITLTDSAWESGTTLIAARVGTAVVTVLSTDGADNGAASAKKLAAQIVTSLKGKTDAATDAAAAQG